MNKIKMLVLSSTENDACDWYRVLGPLSHLEATSDNLELLVHPSKSQLNWRNYLRANVLYYFRPVKANSFNHIECAKRLKIKVWLDFDDDIFNVPLSNPAYKHYSDPAILQSISKCIQAADVVSVSTESIKESFKHLNPNIVVIENAFDNFRVSPRTPRMEKRKGLIFWRGSGTHDEDLLTFAEPMVQLAQEFKDWRWVFLGSPYFVLVNKMPPESRVFLPGIPLPNYFDFLNDCKAAIGIVPLKDNKFNRGKSNIAWQEWSYAGGVSVVPNWPDWQTPGTLGYNDPQTFYQAIRTLLIGKYDIAAINEEAWEYIESNLFLTEVNKKREKLLNELMGVE